MSARFRAVALAALVAVLACSSPAQAEYRGTGPLSVAKGGLATSSPAYMDVAATQAVDGNKGLTGSTTLSGSTQIGATGTAMTSFYVLSITITPSPQAAKNTAGQTFAATGAAVGDTFVSIIPPGMTAGTALSVVRIAPAAKDQALIGWANNSASVIQPTPGTYRILAMRN